MEATTLNQRTLMLTRQDRFCRDNIRSDDVLIVSLGGNDIALLPAPCTIAAIAGLLCCAPSRLIEAGTTCCAPPVSGLQKSLRRITEAVIHGCSLPQRCLNLYIRSTIAVGAVEHRFCRVLGVVHLVWDIFGTCLE